MWGVDHTDDTAVFDNGRRTPAQDAQTLDGDRVQRVVRGQCRSTAVGGVGHDERPGRAREPVGRDEAYITPTVDDWQYPPR